MRGQQIGDAIDQVPGLTAKQKQASKDVAPRGQVIAAVCNITAERIKNAIAQALKASLAPDAVVAAGSARWSRHPASRRDPG